MADKGAGEAAKASASAPAPTDLRLKLQTSYGQAIAWSKGFAAEEKAVLAQTLELAALSDNVAERMKAHYARWVALFVGGELKSAHEAAEVFLREAKLAGDAPRRWVPRAGFGTDLPLARPIRGGSRTFARGAKCLQALLGGIPPTPAWVGLWHQRQGLRSHGRLARRRCDRRRGSIRRSVDRGARFRTRAHGAAPAVEAYLAASAVAREQGARSLGLRAALKLA
jgi:hypothetical protein